MLLKTDFVLKTGISNRLKMSDSDSNSDNSEGDENYEDEFEEPVLHKFYTTEYNSFAIFENELQYVLYDSSTTKALSRHLVQTIRRLAGKIANQRLVLMMPKVAQQTDG